MKHHDTDVARSTEGTALSNRQKKQEEAYELPYHWCIQDELSEKGRLYFGYINFCVNLATNEPGPILDAGCGDGRLLGKLSERNPKAELHGADYSSRAIGFARLLVPDATFAESRLEKLPYADGYFQQIFLIETLEHIPPGLIPKILRELRRVIKTGGSLVITVPSLRMGQPGPDSKHYQHFSPKSLAGAVKDVLEIEKMYGQWRDGFHPLKVIYRLIDNKFYDIKILRRFYNKHVWPRYFNICRPEDGKRLIVECRK